MSRTNEVALNAEKYIDEIRAVRYNFSITKGVVRTDYYICLLKKPRKDEDWVVNNEININISNFLNDYIIQCFDFIQWEDEEPW